MDIVALFHCLQPSVPSTTLHQLSRIALALLVMTGRVTMLGIFRWDGLGGSYRTVQRFCSTVIPCAILFWVFFRGCNRAIPNPNRLIKNFAYQIKHLLKNI